MPSADAAAPLGLLALCPDAGQTPLVACPELADRAGIVSLHVKDERTRMGLGSFKALGAAYVIARDAQAGHAVGRTYATASAGNHGLSVAAGARVFGARSVIYIAETVPQAFADRLAAEGAEVRRDGAIYEASMAAAAKAAEEEGLVLLSDSSWPGYVELPHRLMEGYTAMMAEAADQMPEPPTHVFLQAGVGGLAAASARYARAVWGDAPRIIVVEPQAAPALFASIQAGQPVVAPGPVSAMGRLDCKEPSLIALKGLAADADAFVTISEDQSLSATETIAAAGLPSTPSGTAGIAALLSAAPLAERLGLDQTSRAFCILSEGPEA